MGNNNSLKSNILKAFSANFIATLAGFASAFIFPKILSIDDYAIYHTYTLYLGYIAILHLGFPSGMVINYAGVDYDRVDKSKYKSEIVILMGILSVFTVLFLCYNFVKPSLMLTLVSLSIIPVCWIGSYKALLQTWNNFNAYTRINIFLSLSIPVLSIVYYVIKKSLPGYTYMYIYFGIYTLTTVVLLVKSFKDLKTVQAKRILSKENFETGKTGIIIAAGSYINTLFTSADKQFVSWFFSNAEFAYYSFAMSMQSIMLVLITSIAQPLFPAMAQNRFQDTEYNDVKKLLFIFGSFSGCAYFAISIIVKLFIPKYIDSLSVASLYFSVFPAMAVIQCLYINLYKLKGKVKTYVATLLGVLGIAVVLNLAMVKIMGQFTGIAIATVATYYVWLIIGTIQFEFIKFSIRDFIYLTLYFLVYFVCTMRLNDYAGIIVYGLIIVALAIVIYKSVIWKYFGKFIVHKK